MQSTGTWFGMRRRFLWTCGPMSRTSVGCSVVQRFVWPSTLTGASCPYVSTPPSLPPPLYLRPCATMQVWSEKVRRQFLQASTQRPARRVDPSTRTCLPHYRHLLACLLAPRPGARAAPSSSASCWCTSGKPTGHIDLDKKPELRDALELLEEAKRLGLPSAIEEVSLWSQCVYVCMSPGTWPCALLVCCRMET